MHTELLVYKYLFLKRGSNAGACRRPLTTVCTGPEVPTATPFDVDKQQVYMDLA